MAAGCESCKLISKQCSDLKFEVALLNKKLNKLIESLSGEKREVFCQTDYFHSCISSSSQTDIDKPSQNFANLSVQTDEIQTDEIDQSSNVLMDLPTSVEDVQTVALYDIFVNAQQLTASEKPSDSITKNHNSISCPILDASTVSHVTLNDQPFSQFDLIELDRDIEFDVILGNRLVKYFGDFSYSYGTINHQPCPIPGASNYLHKILNHVRTVLPTFSYNSILITKYTDGSKFIDYHSDNEPEIAEDSDILTISLGETRVISFKHLSNCRTDTEKSHFLRHGDAFLMSQKSQESFQHSIVADNSKDTRISLTLRQMNPTVTNNSQGQNGSISNLPNGSIPNLPSNNSQAQYDTIYISDSMLRNLSSTKMSSLTQKAMVFAYPGATAGGILEKLKTDNNFHNLDPSKVKRIFLFCGTNNVDNVLCTPPYMRSEFLSGYQINNNILFESKEQITLLSQFLHSWANSAVINVLNILPRVSFIRNSVINKLNYHILQLCNKYSYIKIVSTESHRSLFSFHNGLRKDNFFMTKGGDNVHLNKIGLSRLAKYLKYYSHHS